jgi:predicted PurR-regulated permease PerM
VRQPNWTRILTILLVVLAAYALLYLTASVLFRFTQAILLFVLGAIVAYILTPLVNRLESAFRARWLAILLSYCLLAAGLFAIGVLLFTPFVQQSQSLVDNLRNPSSASLRTITTLQNDARTVHQDLLANKASVEQNLRLLTGQAQLLNADVDRLQRDITNVRHGTITGQTKTHYVKRGTNGRLPPNPSPQTQVPTSYIDPLATQAHTLLTSWSAASSDPSNVNVAQYDAAITNSEKLATGSQHMFHVMSTTPIALIRAQTWLDQHGIKNFNVEEKFGQAASQISNQGTDVLTNVITIVQATANILLNVALILIIAFYFLLDAGRLIRSGIDLIPGRYREQAWFFIQSLDQVLGGYIRGQLFLSALAGVLGGGGAALLGVPYPLLIGIMTFLLQNIPVIGPMVAFLPAALISLFFTPPLTTVILVAWFIIFQQVVTNVIGPRINSMAVGIHPLEAMLAVLVGYPLGGLLGAFLAVPLAGIIHIVIRSLYAYFALGHSLPTAEVPASMEDELNEAPQRTAAAMPSRETGRAVGK